MMEVTECAFQDLGRKPPTGRRCVMRVGNGGGGFGDAIATRPCARLLAYWGDEVGVDVAWGTRFPSCYQGLVETMPYEDVYGSSVLDLHWACFPEGPASHFECFFSDAVDLLRPSSGAIDQVLADCGGQIKPTWNVSRRPQRMVVINTFGGIPAKRWGDARWQLIANRLADKGWLVVQLNPNGYHLANVNVYSSKDPNEMAQHLGQYAMYLGNESALWFIAMGIGLPSVTVHGPCDGSWYNVNPQRHRTVDAKGSCKHCYDRGPWNVGKRQDEFDIEAWDAWYHDMRRGQEVCGLMCIDHGVDDVWDVIEDHLSTVWRSA